MPLIIMASVLYCPTALADWAVAGAQYACSPKKGSFTLLKYVESSDGNSEIKPGFSVLPDGESNITCHLGRRSLTAKIIIYPPQDHGECAGGGSVDVISIAVDGVELADHNITFIWSCSPDYKPIDQIFVKTNGANVDYKECNTDDSKPECTKKSFEIDKISAAHKKIDHQLADPDTQAKQSAKSLPPGNDLAKVFPASIYVDPKAPLCAHWHAGFYDNMGADRYIGRQRYARIAGKEGVQIHIYRANPQLCERPDDEGCNPEQYLLPGDRVAVGFICGKWTRIKRKSRVRSVPDVDGWIRTNQLYGFVNFTQEKALKTSSDIGLNDPGELVRLARYDRLFSWIPKEHALDPAPLVKALLAAGANPNLTDKYNCYVLCDTMESNNVDIAKLLLDFGANPNGQSENIPNTPLGKAYYWFNLTYDPTMFKMLLEHGADPNFRDKSKYDEEYDSGRTPFAGQTLLTRAAEDGHYTLVRVLLEHGANPIIPREDGALAENIARDHKHMKIAALIARYINKSSSSDKLPIHNNSGSNRASFNCQKARTHVEKLICSNSELGSDDIKMAFLYRDFLALGIDKAKVRAAQRHWLKTVRDTCQNVACLKHVYAGRIATFQTALIYHLR